MDHIKLTSIQFIHINSPSIEIKSKSIYLTFLLLNFKSHVFDDNSNLFQLGFYWFTYTSFNLTSSFKLNLFYQNSNCISYQLIYYSHNILHRIPESFQPFKTIFETNSIILWISKPKTKFSRQLPFKIIWQQFLFWKPENEF